MNTDWQVGRHPTRAEMLDYLKRSASSFELASLVVGVNQYCYTVARRFYAMLRRIRDDRLDNIGENIGIQNAMLAETYANIVLEEDPIVIEETLRHLTALNRSAAFIYLVLLCEFQKETDLFYSEFLKVVDGKKALHLGLDTVHSGGFLDDTRSTRDCPSEAAVATAGNPRLTLDVLYALRDRNK